VKQRDQPALCEDMPFPESQRSIFTRNPLQEVICQLRFPPILSIGTSPPADFQAIVRTEYPFYESEHSLGIPPELNGLFERLSVKPPAALVHRFMTDESEDVSSRQIALTNSFLAIHTKSYVRWEEFHTDILRAQTTLEHIYAPVFYSRIGLRYLNVIDRDLLELSGIGWDELLNPALAGLLRSADVRADVTQITTQTVLNLNDEFGSSLSLRFGLAEQPEADSRVFVVDADFFTTQRTEKTNVERILASYNRAAGNLFRWAISERLHAALGPVPVE
jgi:uncharacterized protein (TIGR04255 family)